MTRPATLAAGIAALTATALFAKPLGYAVPPDATPPQLAGAEAQIVVDNCAACHSLDYIVTQPRGKGPQFWSDEVDKMIKVYKAPVAAGDAAAIKKALAARFG